MVKLNKKWFKEVTKEIYEFADGKNPKNLRVYQYKDGKSIEIINELKLIKE